MFRHHVFKARPGKCIFLNISKNKVEIVKGSLPPKFVTTLNKLYKIEEYGKIGRVFVFIDDGEIKSVYD